MPLGCETKKGSSLAARSIFAAVILGLLLGGGNTARGQSAPPDAREEGIRALQAGEFAHAQQILAALVKRSPSAENIGYLAMAEAGAGNLAQAIGHFQESIRLGNNSAAVHYNLGIADLNSGRREEAIRELRAAIARDAKFLPPRYPLGVALLEGGRPRQALPYLEQAKELSPHEADVWANLVRAQFEIGNDKAALQTADRAMGAIPNNSSLAVALANLCFQHGQAQKARHLLEDANALNPRDASIALLLARVSLQAGEPKETLAVLENVPPDAGAPGEIMFLRGEARALTGNLTVAEVDLSAAREADPRDLRYLIAYAWLQQRKGRYKEALTTLNKAYEVDSQTPFIPFRMAVSYYFLGVNAQAVQACQDAIRLDPHYAAAYLLLGAVRLQQKDFQGAQSALEHAIALKPQVTLFHLALGMALYKGGRLAESGKELNRVLILDPRATPAYFYRARVYARQGERRKAIADLETTVALDPHYREAYAELAQLYSADGQSEKAAAALAKDSVETQSEENEDKRMLQRLRDLPDAIRGLGLDFR